MSSSKLRFVLLMFLFLASSANAALSRDELDAWCGKFFQGGPWRMVQDGQIEQWAREFFAHAGVSATPVVCIGAPSVPYSVASQRGSHGPDRYFYVALNSDFRRAVGDELRAIIAHEVAHIVTGDSIYCSDRESEGGYALCEHITDRLADSWAGRGTVARSLEWGIRYLEGKKNGSNDAGIDAMIKASRQRIALLR